MYPLWRLVLAVGFASSPLSTLLYFTVKQPLFQYKEKRLLLRDARELGKGWSLEPPRHGKPRTRVSKGDISSAGGADAMDRVCVEKFHWTGLWALYLDFIPRNFVALDHPCPRLEVWIYAPTNRLIF